MPPVCDGWMLPGGYQERRGRRVYWWLMEAQKHDRAALWRVLTDLLPEYILRDLHSGAVARLGGHRRRAAFLFADLVGYTSMWHQLNTDYHDRPLLRRQVALLEPNSSTLLTSTFLLTLSPTIPPRRSHTLGMCEDSWA